MALPDARSTRPEGRSTSTTKVDAATRSLVNNAKAFAQTTYVELELSDSSVDLDLQNVEREINKLNAERTTDKIQRSLNAVLAKIKAKEPLI
jgi:F0F1-type ATP synthase epsilon subunit